jgi:hypothetical protein
MGPSEDGPVFFIVTRPPTLITPNAKRDENTIPAAIA